MLDEELVKAGDRAQGLVGGESALEWQAAKNKWAASNVIAENAARGASKDSKNRVFGLSEQLGASRGGALGTAVGAALGSVVPVFGTAAGGLAGGLLGSHMGAYAAGMTRRYGDQVISKVARDAGTDGLMRAGINEVDRMMDSKLGTYLGEKGIQGAAAAKNKLGDLLEKAGVESGQAAVKATETGAKVDKAAVRAADAAERTATRTEEKIAGQVSKLEAEAWGCANTASMLSRELVVRSRLWRTSKLTSPTTWVGVCRNMSSERVTTPSVEFSTPTTPYWALPAAVA